MNYIAHRINTLEELCQIPVEFGVELDLRDRGNRLILSHDPFVDGEDAEPFFEAYRHGTLILNIKSERIEHRVEELLRTYHITDYFYLDSSFPMIRLLSSQGETNLAVRFSEYEGIDTVLSMAGRVQWVWVDCFTYLPITKDVEDLFRLKGFKWCLVSPELQGRDADIEIYGEQLISEGLKPDAICSKSYNISRWKQFFA